MIRADLEEGGVVLRGDIVDEAVAYIDSDWVPRTQGGPVPVLLFEQGVHVRWRDRPPEALPKGLDADRAAALVLEAVARDAADAVAHAPADLIEVLGDGFIARRVRALLRVGEDARHDVAPLAIVDATGDPELVLASTRRLADGGMLVLAGEPKAQLDLDLYPDVHVRGLELVGIAPPLSRGAPWVGAVAGESAADGDFDPPVRLTPGSALHPNASWYAVTSGDGD